MSCREAQVYNSPPLLLISSLCPSGSTGLARGMHPREADAELIRGDNTEINGNDHVF